MIGGQVLLLLCILSLQTTLGSCRLQLLAPRNGLVVSIPSRTSSVVHATAISTIGNSLKAPANRFNRLIPRHTTVPITPSPAVLIYQGSYISVFPASVCGFVSGDPEQLVRCIGGNACAVASGRLCCADGGVCELGSPYSDCQNVQITDYHDDNYGRSSFVLTSKLHCDIYQGQQCHLDRVGSIEPQPVCSTTDEPASLSIYPPSQFIEYFRGYTVKWDAAWRVLAISSSTITTSTTSSTTGSSTSVQPTDPAGFLSKFSSDPPSCVINMTNLCSDMYAQIQNCYFAVVQDDSCYCNAFGQNTCEGLCLEGSQPNDFLTYIVPTCQSSSTKQTNGSSTNETTANWTSTWSDYANLSNAAYANLFPWKWDVRLNVSELTNSTSNSTEQQNSGKQETGHCPTVTSTLLAFATVNMAVFVASILTANRLFLSWLTRGYFGDSKGNKWWPAMALVTVLLSLCSNVVNAFLIKAIPGYHHVPFWQLILLWCTRPRLAWLVIFLVWLTEYFGMDKSIYLDSAVATLMAEVILQAIGAFYMGLTVDHARSNGFFVLGHLKYTPYGSDALIMYVGSLIWIVSIGMLFIWAIITFTAAGPIIWAFLRGCAILLCWCWYWVMVYPIKYPMYLVRCRSRPSRPKFKPKLWFYVGDLMDGEIARMQPQRGEGGAVGSRTDENQPSNQEAAAFSQKEGSSSNNNNNNNNNNGYYDNNYYYDRTHSQPKSNETDTRNRKSKCSKAVPEMKSYLVEMGLDPYRFMNQLATLVLLLLIPWASQWIFWIGFARMARDLYCPPDIWTLTGVWSAFSVLATFFGTF